jgi:hypothetical protein
MRPSRNSSLYVVAGFLVAGAPAVLSAQVADPDATRFENAMATFARYDARNSFPADATVFVGSSSIVGWDTGDRFRGMPLINRGFGGSQMSDLVHYVEETVLKYAPRTVVVYEGDNDTSAGKRSQQLLEDYQEFVEAVLAAQPSTRIIILSIKPAWRVGTCGPRCRLQMPPSRRTPRGTLVSISSTSVPPCSERMVCRDPSSSSVTGYT